MTEELSPGRPRADGAPAPQAGVSEFLTTSTVAVPAALTSG